LNEQLKKKVHDEERRIKEDEESRYQIGTTLAIFVGTALLSVGAMMAIERFKQ
jgi:hypothetical protein